MNCDRAQELFSDHADGRLAGPLDHELCAHLRSCGSCQALASSLDTVVAALGALEPAEPPPALTERILAETLPALRERRANLLSFAQNRVTPHPAPSWHPPPWSWVAVAAAVVLVLAWRPPELLREASREATQTAHRAYSFGVRTYQDTERWVDDLNVLRMTVGVAFEDRIDHLTERLRDLDEARRRGAGTGTGAGAGTSDEPRDESSSSGSLDRFVASSSEARRAPADAVAAAAAVSTRSPHRKHSGPWGEDPHGAEHPIRRLS